MSYISISWSGFPKPSRKQDLNTMSDFTYVLELFNVITVLFRPSSRNLTEKSQQLLWLASPFVDPALVELKSISSHDSVSLMVGSD